MLPFLSLLLMIRKYEYGFMRFFNHHGQASWY
jgi:hypothetical protein